LQEENATKVSLKVYFSGSLLFLKYRQQQLSLASSSKKSFCFFYHDAIILEVLKSARAENCIDFRHCFKFFPPFFQYRSFFRAPVPVDDI
jgi:hypothetical protein